MKTRRVTVVGGGIIGLTTAHALLTEGHSVTLIERHTLGSGAATGNAGEITPQQVAPLASPSVAKDVIKGIFSKNHYLSIAPLKLHELVGFGLGFLGNSIRIKQVKGARRLALFADGIFPALDRLAEAGIDVSGGGNKFLMTCSNEKQLVAAHENYQGRAARGWGEAPGPIMRGEKLREFEPTLAENVNGGFLLPAERYIDPVTFIASLASRVRELGAEILEGTTVTGIADSANVTVRNSADETRVHTADTVVLCAGAFTSEILRKNGVRSRAVVAGKGYSFTLPVKNMPRQLIHSLDRHCVLIPMNGRLRVVGIMEFDQRPDTLNASRIEVLVNQSRQVIKNGNWNNISDEWCGPRPMTANGLPLIGRVQGHPELIVATGHNMHGLSLGPITGEIVADLVAERQPRINNKPIDLKAFKV